MGLQFFMTKNGRPSLICKLLEGMYNQEPRVMTFSFITVLILLPWILKVRGRQRNCLRQTLASQFGR